ncbi:MAG: F0F1 ATP synthase subunit B [Bacteroidetes bacterium]|nr:F0F1 ATP synthase subunit B [Bacteroidota bacterium]
MLQPEFGLIFWTLLVFLIVLFLLTKFAWKPITKALKEREDSIEESLNSAEKAREEMAKLKAENEKLLAEAIVERDKMFKEAREASSRIIDEAKEKASQEGAKLIENAKEVINNEKQAALAEVKNQVASLSIQIAEKLLRKKLSDIEVQKELIDDLIKDISVN